MMHTEHRKIHLVDNNHDKELSLLRNCSSMLIVKCNIKMLVSNELIRIKFSTLRSL